MTWQQEYEQLFPPPTAPPVVETYIGPNPFLAWRCVDRPHTWKRDRHWDIIYNGVFECNRCGLRAYTQNDLNDDAPLLALNDRERRGWCWASVEMFGFLIVVWGNLLLTILAAWFT